MFGAGSIREHPTDWSRTLLDYVAGHCLLVYPASLPRFESSSHAISMSAYLREQRRELYSRSGELQGR